MDTETRSEGLTIELDQPVEEEQQQQFQHISRPRQSNRGRRGRTTYIVPSSPVKAQPAYKRSQSPRRQSSPPTQNLNSSQNDPNNTSGSSSAPGSNGGDGTVATKKRVIMGGTRVLPALPENFKRRRSVSRRPVARSPDGAIINTPDPSAIGSDETTDKECRSDNGDSEQGWGLVVGTLIGTLAMVGGWWFYTHQKKNPH